MSIGVKKFRQILRKKGLQRKTRIYRVTQVKSIETVEREINANQELLGCENPKLKAVLQQQYESVFHDELPSGLPPERDIDHAIEIDEKVKPPHWHLFQLSPAELEAAKEYI